LGDLNKLTQKYTMAILVDRDYGGHSKRAIDVAKKGILIFSEKAGFYIKKAPIFSILLLKKAYLCNI